MSTALASGAQSRLPRSRHSINKSNNKVVSYRFGIIFKIILLNVYVYGFRNRRLRRSLRLRQSRHRRRSHRHGDRQSLDRHGRLAGHHGYGSAD